MRLRECNAAAFAALPRLSPDEVQHLWIHDFYDGPLEGMARFNGELAWYVLAEEEQEPYSEGWYRRYWLVRISPEQASEEKKWNEFCRAYFHGETSESERNRFHELHSQRAPLVLDENEVLGWFESEALDVRPDDS